jgi:hypothetical protein
MIHVGAVVPSRGLGPAGSAKLHSVKLSADLYARCVLASTAAGVSIEQFTADALGVALERTRWKVKEGQFRQAVAEAERSGRPTPQRWEYGLE